jgi:hypothetical protein
MFPAAVTHRRPVVAGRQSYRDPYGPGAPRYLADQSILKKLRLRIDNDDSQFPAYKKLKIRGKDLNDLPPEVFEIVELEVRMLPLYKRKCHIAYCIILAFSNACVRACVCSGLNCLHLSYCIGA